MFVLWGSVTLHFSWSQCKRGREWHSVGPVASGSVRRSGGPELWIDEDFVSVYGVLSALQSYNFCRIDDIISLPLATKNSQVDALACRQLQ